MLPFDDEEPTDVGRVPLQPDRDVIERTADGATAHPQDPLSEGARAFPPPLAGNPASFGDSPVRPRRRASGTGAGPRLG